jgi:hypothetical protein
LIKGYFDLQVAELPINAAKTAKAEEILTAVALQTLTPNPIITLPSYSSSTSTVTPLSTEIPTSSPAKEVEDQFVGLIDMYYSCINGAMRNADSDYKRCWDLLSDYPGEIQDNQNKLNSGNGVEAFSDFWNDFKIGYTLYSCQRTINGVLVNLVDAEYILYNWNDLSIPISQGKKFYIEYSFGLDNNGWRIKGANDKITNVGSYCAPYPSIEKWNPVP